MNCKIFAGHLNTTTPTSYVLDTDNKTPLERAVNDYISKFNERTKLVQILQSQSYDSGISAATRLTITVFYSPY